jgi:hypothetical protein
MDTLIGVKDLRVAPLRKAELLLCDKVALVERGAAWSGSAEQTAEIQWLQEEGLVFQVDAFTMYVESSDTSEKFRFQIAGWMAHSLKLAFQLREKYHISNNDLTQFRVFNDRYIESALRLISGGVEHSLGVRTVPLIDRAEGVMANTGLLDLKNALAFLQSLPIGLRSERMSALSASVPSEIADVMLIQATEDLLALAISSTELRPDSSSPVLQLVLGTLPIPDASTLWEQIIDFRNDEAARRDCIALRRWMRKVAEANTSPVELREELEFLLNEYRSHMRIHKMKHGTGVAQTILTVGVEALENLAKFKWTAAVKAFFSVRERKAELLAAEHAAPGREVAYIIKVQDRFTSGAT